jgi:4-hydroxy-3-polyprenylbenzoate decarboxylase
MRLMVGLTGATGTVLGAIRLENVLALARMGVWIVPPMPAFSNRPESVTALVDHIVDRALDQFGLQPPSAKRWEGMRASRSARPNGVPDAHPTEEPHHGP